MTHRYPLALQSDAKHIPVLPDVPSTTVPPSVSSPLASASLIMLAAMRSLLVPPGFRYSTYSGIACIAYPTKRSDEKTRRTGRDRTLVLHYKSSFFCRFFRGVGWRGGGYFLVLLMAKDVGEGTKIPPFFRLLFILSSINTDGTSNIPFYCISPVVTPMVTRRDFLIAMQDQHPWLLYLAIY